MASQADLGKHPDANPELGHRGLAARELTQPEQHTAGKLAYRGQAGDKLPEAEQDPDSELRDCERPDRELSDRHDPLGHTATAVGIPPPGDVHPRHTYECRLRLPLVSRTTPGAVGWLGRTTVRAGRGLGAHLALAFAAPGHRHVRLLRATVCGGRRVVGVGPF